MVDITPDVLNHMSVFFFQDTMNIPFYMLLHLYSNSSFYARILLRSCVIWHFELCNTMLMFVPHLCVGGRSMFCKHLESEVWGVVLFGILSYVI